MDGSGTPPYSGALDNAIGSAIVWCFAMLLTAGWARRKTWRVATVLAGLTMVYGMVHLRFPSLVPRPSFEWLVLPTPAWKPLLQGGVIGVLIGFTAHHRFVARLSVPSGVPDAASNLQPDTPSPAAAAAAAEPGALVEPHEDATTARRSPTPTPQEAWDGLLALERRILRLLWSTEDHYAFVNEIRERLGNPSPELWNAATHQLLQGGLARTICEVPRRSPHQGPQAALALTSQGAALMTNRTRSSFAQNGADTASDEGRWLALPADERAVLFSIWEQGRGRMPETLVEAVRRQYGRDRWQELEQRLASRGFIAPGQGGWELTQAATALVRWAVQDGQVIPIEH